MDDRYNLFFNAMRNPTKMKIITLLINYEKLSATDMKKYIKTTRSNIYQCIGNLMADGMITGPKNVVKKNYVEKYYSINRQFFISINGGMDERLSELDNKQFRDVIVSFFMAQSMNLSLLAEQIENFPENEIGKIKEEMENKISVSYGSISQESSIKLVHSMKEALSGLPEDENENYMFLSVIFPGLKELLSKVDEKIE